MSHGGTALPNGAAVDAMFFKNYGVNPFVDTEDDPLSTFATDVDTGSYVMIRHYLQNGNLPPEDAVRVEECINYFHYDYLSAQEKTFNIHVDAVRSHVGRPIQNSILMRVGLHARGIENQYRKPAVLTFVIDVSGSMDRENRLGLVKKSLRYLIDHLNEQDHIGIVVYGDQGRKILEPTSVAEKDKILSVIGSLSTGGATYAEQGIRMGYEMAEQAFRRGCINRIILCSDGVANVGMTGADQILEMVTGKVDKGITISSIGFGMGNYNDVLLERLGDKGGGQYAYVDTLLEAKRLFGENLTSTLQIVARDVKVQVEFNPEVVRSYRLIGYENRDVPDDKFRNNKYDGGEVGSGHQVTALYVLKLWPGKNGVLATTHLRYQDVDLEKVVEFEESITTDAILENIEQVDRDFRLAAVVAEFAEVLRNSYWARGIDIAQVLERLQGTAKEFSDNHSVIEFLDLVSKARRLSS
ncbi:von Willebrand factor type A domain-containing protein [Planctomycetota bacterium]